MSDTTQNPAPTPEEPAGTTSATPPPPPPTTGYVPGPAPAPPVGAPASGAGQPADLGPRFLARLIDYIILAVVNGIITTILATAMNVSGGGFGMTLSGAVGYVIVAAIIQAVLYLGYFAFMESSRGQTVGKMVLKLRTLSPGGGNPTMEQAIRRNIWNGLPILGVIPVLGSIVAGIGQLVAVIMCAVGISNSPTRQAWHDRFAGGTQVVKNG